MRNVMFRARGCRRRRASSLFAKRLAKFSDATICVPFVFRSAPSAVIAESAMWSGDPA